MAKTALDQYIIYVTSMVLLISALKLLSNFIELSTVFSALMSPWSCNKYREVFQCRLSNSLIRKVSLESNSIGPIAHTV